MTKTYTLYFSLVSIFILSGCSNKAHITDYFPLNIGLKWEYRHQLSYQDEHEYGSYTVTNFSESKIEGESVITRRADNGRDYYLTKNEDGIYRYATRTLFETYPKKDTPPRMVLPTPFLDSLGTQWSSSTTHYVIKRTGPSTVSSANDAVEDFVMNYRVTSISETVDVPAGKFENCILVEGLATLTLFADPHTGFEDIPIRSREWYAPGVGLVKFERTEPLHTRIYKGGSHTFELTKFSG